MLLSEFDYDLKLDRIAQEPLPNRDRSKLLLLDRNTGEMGHRHFYELTKFLRPDDLLVLNDTKVTAVRLHGRKPTGAKVEALLIHNLGDNRWDAVVKPGRRVDVGHSIIFDDLGISADVVGRSDGGCRILDFGDDPGVCEAIERVGEVPLPPYISTVLEDRDRYQTVYANEPGSAAAPTAGFHFTPELFAEIHAMGIRTAFVTLHVGIATFRPVRTEQIEDHIMHYEHISISPEVADTVNSAPGRIISVGTTTARVLESAAVGKRRVEAIDRQTNLFIKPGYDFQILDGLITNFHMPRSTLMVLVSAFAGRKSIMNAYREAAEQDYRFLSFGDAMFIS